MKHAYFIMTSLCLTFTLAYTWVGDREMALMMLCLAIYFEILEVKRR